MKYLHTTLLCFVLIGTGLCAEGKVPAQLEQIAISFSELSEAIQFITVCLAQEDFEKLSGACVGGRKPNVYLAQHRGVFDKLKGAHEKTPLQNLYAKRSFPKDAETFKLGGHMAELGCIHIDFVKKGDSWYLADIWECK